MGPRLKLPDYVHAFNDRHGRPRHYLRRPGYKRVPLPGLPWSPEFMEAYAMGMAGDAPRIKIAAKRSRPGSVSAVIASYYRHELWLQELSEGSRKTRRPILEKFRAAHGEKKIALLRGEHITKILAGMKPFAKRNWLKTLRGLAVFCVMEHHIKRDPTQDVRLVRLPKTTGHMTWREKEIEQYRAYHPNGTMARLALELMLNLAARRQDACRLGRPHVQGDRLTWRPQKTARSTGKVLTIRMTPDFKIALQAIPASDSMTFLNNDYGRPFASAAAFGNKFADWCREAGLPVVVGEDGRARNFRAHGLRKAACRALAHAGCSAPEIMAVSGRATLSQVQIYIAEVEQERMAEAAMNRLVEANKTASLIGKP